MGPPTSNESNEEEFRALLDLETGVLRSGALTAKKKRKLTRENAYAVFAQRDDAIFDIGALQHQASRFFNAKLGLTVEKKYSLHRPYEDVAHVLLNAEDGATVGTRLCYGRAADVSDHAAAARAEEMQNTSGMSLLAERCKMLWLVILDDGAADAEGDADRVALTIAAILASAFLGPVLSPNGTELFGVRTARMKLEKRAAPYR